MFSQDAADRTLPPTERRRREVRARGDVVRSSALTSSIVLLAASFAFWWFAADWAVELASFLRRSVSISPTFPATNPAVLTRQIGQIFGIILIPFAAVVLTGAITANLAQAGWVWNPTSITPHFRWRGLFSWERLGESGVHLVRLCLLGSVSWVFLSGHHVQIFSVSQGAPAGLLIQGAQTLGELSVQLSMCLVGLALVDYAYRFLRHEQRLKMTIEERRREQCDDEIDPAIKKRRLASRNSQPAIATAPMVEAIGSNRR